MRNLLIKQGYPDLDAVREEGRSEGRLEQTREILRIQLATRGWTVSSSLGARITATTALPTLMRWLSQVASAGDVEASLR